MNATEREQVRLCLLKYLDAHAGRRWALSEAALRLNLRNDGFPDDADATGAELDYLREKGLIQVEAKVISPENRTWRITAAGRDFFANQ